jgi:hypothetical protein
MNTEPLRERILEAAGRSDDALARALAVTYVSETHVSTAGYPALSEAAYSHFRDHVPQLFGPAGKSLQMLAELESAAESLADADNGPHLERAARVMRTVLNTAAITAAPDLWLVRHVVGALHEVGLAPLLLGGSLIDPEAATDSDGHSLDAAELRTDLNLLVTRGYLRREGGAYALTAPGPAAALFERLGPVSPGARATISAIWHRAFTGGGLTEAERELLLELTAEPPTPGARNHETWVATWEEVDLSWRVLPVVVALKMAGRCESLGQGESLSMGMLAPGEPELEAGALGCLEAAGFVTLTGQAAMPTLLGKRAFQRAPGPYGIIETYQPYMSRLVDILRDGKNAAWVSRGANVIASQAANRRTFVQCNDALDTFCAETGFTYGVFIEHALGRGEATRQRWERAGEAPIAYVGADLEDASVEQALAEQGRGHLPEGMLFVRQADIGDPAYLVSRLRANGVQSEGAVMMVGNGFHEVRNQTDDKMERIFRGYHEAGMVLIFTEASALTVEDLLHTAFNTYHAGFMYVHAKSGQGLRPADPVPVAMRTPELQSSWTECATRAGYVKAERFISRSRTVYPHPRSDGYNPTISTNHFFVPADLAKRLGFGE